MLTLTPLRLEQFAVSRSLPGHDVARTGAGPTRASRAAARLRSARPPAVAVAGLAGALRPGLRPGTVVLADSVLVEGGRTVAVLPSAQFLAADLRRRGITVVVGPVISTPKVASGTRRQALAASGALAVDCETAYLLEAGWEAPVAVLRVVVDTPERELWSASSVTGGVRALRALSAAAPSLDRWARSLADRRILLAGPRSFCAGVERAITTVEKALDRFGPPLYVRRQIVHNRHVVQELEGRGAVFVREIGEVPQGATVVLSAHGVAPQVRADAAARDLHVIDATCPLVAKVHSEVRRFTERGYQIVLVGHPGHDETEGTLGEAEDVTLVTTVADVEGLEVRDPSKLAYITQTTLAPSDVAGIVAELSSRYPSIAGPHAGDICYATQNRQDAVAAIAGECDLVLVVGSENSSNAARLVEVSERSGCPAHLIEDDTELHPDWFEGATTIGITAAASTPSHLVEQVVAAVGGLGTITVEERQLRQENISFSLPLEVR